MEGVILEPEFFGNLELSVTGIFVLLAVAIAGCCFGYLADEDRLGRTHYWSDEPLCGVSDFTPEEEAKAPEYRKAA